MTLLLLASACVSRHPAASVPPALPVGSTWDLQIDGEPDWHHHALALDARVDGRLRGRLWFDRSLGPEGRAPTPDEVRHELTFDAALDPPLALALTVGTFEPLALTLTLAPEGEALVGLAGLDGAPPVAARALRR